MRLAVSEYGLSGNPCTDLKLSVDERDVLDRKPFSPVHLTRLCESPVFHDPPKLTKGACGAAAFWIPLISLFSGARLEEIGQLPLSDTLEEGGIHYFWFREDEAPDEDEQEPRQRRRRRRRKSEQADPEVAKSIKTKAGRRRVPFHQILIDLGILDYIKARREAGDVMLFPQLKPYRGRYTKNFSRFWARYQDEHITPDEAIVFHSLRHKFIGQLRGAGVEEEYIKALVGHARELQTAKERKTNNVTDIYGDAYPIPLLNAKVQRVNYPTLVLKRIDAFTR
jgi:hypothetical protein